MLRKYLIFVLFLVISAAGFAQDGGDPKSKKSDPKDKESIVRTRHTVTIDGKKIAYEAAAGTMTLKEEDGKTTANIFHVAYTKQGEDLGKRPITFCFNGGPGSSSVWLHLGTFGPKRVLLSEDGNALKPPARLVDNEWSILDVTDLVFIDPVSTGYSRAAEEKNAKNFHGVEEDVHAVAEFIRLYTTRNKRWQSPKYLAGESYGTTRSAALSNHLQSRVNMRLNGILLVSSILNFQTIRFDEGNDLPFALFLPSYTATAWYHKKLDKNLQGDFRKTLAEVEKFALGEYTTALMKGSKLEGAERQAVTKKLARFTGLSETYVERANLRIEGQRFMRELLREEGYTVGRFDSRIKGKDGT
jgi:carboxypeptidase C (cathepsin A)